MKEVPISNILISKLYIKAYRTLRVRQNLLKYLKSHELDAFLVSEYEELNMKNYFNLDYVFVLKKNEMPIISMFKNKEVIDNKPFNLDEKNYNTKVEGITINELLGFFACVDVNLINELKENDVNELRTSDCTTFVNGKIKVEDLLNKNVIFICDDNIEEVCNDVQELKTNEDIIKYFNLENDKYVDEYIDDIRNWFNRDTITEFVFYHELGHSIFYGINNTDNLVLKERQANYMASILLDGKYDKLIEIYNNFIGKEYKNPLLKSSTFKLDPDEYDKQVSELYGDIDGMER